MKKEKSALKVPVRVFLYHLTKKRKTLFVGALRQRGTSADVGTVDAHNPLIIHQIHLTFHHCKTHSSREAASRLTMKKTITG